MRAAARRASAPCQTTVLRGEGVDHVAECDTKVDIRQHERGVGGQRRRRLGQDQRATRLGLDEFDRKPVAQRPAARRHVLGGPHDRVEGAAQFARDGAGNQRRLLAVVSASLVGSRARHDDVDVVGSLLMRNPGGSPSRDERVDVKPSACSCAAPLPVSTSLSSMSSSRSTGCCMNGGTGTSKSDTG